MTRYKSPPFLHEYQPARFSFVNQLPLLGPMRQYVSKKHSLEQIYNLDQHSDNDIPKLKRVRAYPVPALVGKVFEIHHSDELSNALYTLIQQTLHTIEWEPFEVSTAPFHKYFIVHCDIPAPPDQLTGQPMSLEIFASLVRVNGISLNSEEGQRWVDTQYLLRYQAHSSEPAESALVGDFEIKIEIATYSNVKYLGVGIPLYL